MGGGGGGGGGRKNNEEREKLKVVTQKDVKCQEKGKS